MISTVNVTPEFRKKFHEEIEERRKRGISAPGERLDVFTFVPDLNTPQAFRNSWPILLSKRGHSDSQIEKILGGNFAGSFAKFGARRFC